MLLRTVYEHLEGTTILICLVGHHSFARDSCARLSTQNTLSEKLRQKVGTLEELERIANRSKGLFIHGTSAFSFARGLDFIGSPRKRFERLDGIAPSSKVLYTFGPVDGPNYEKSIMSATSYAEHSSAAPLVFKELNLQEFDSSDSSYAVIDALSSIMYGENTAFEDVIERYKRLAVSKQKIQTIESFYAGLSAAQVDKIYALKDDVLSYRGVLLVIRGDDRTKFLDPEHSDGSAKIFSLDKSLDIDEIVMIVPLSQKDKRVLDSALLR